MKAVLVALALMISVVSAVAQQSNASLTPQQEAVTIKPKLMLGDVKALSNFLLGIEIRGNEVDAFLDARKTLTAAAEAAAKAGKKDEDVITVDMRLDIAQNIFLLMQRASLKGAEAEKFKQIITSMQDAARDAQKK
jgi:ribosomal protein S1